jgi:hypothetical protein
MYTCPPGSAIDAQIFEHGQLAFRGGGKPLAHFHVLIGRKNIPSGFQLGAIGSRQRSHQNEDGDGAPGRDSAHGFARASDLDSAGLHSVSHGLGSHCAARGCPANSQVLDVRQRSPVKTIFTKLQKARRYAAYLEYTEILAIEERKNARRGFQRGFGAGRTKKSGPSPVSRFGPVLTWLLFAN